jgi:hypothetical protein
VAGAATLGAMPRRQDDRVPARSAPVAGRRVDLRTALLAGGGLLAVVATVLVFLTDDPDLLRVAVVAAAWAFVLATVVAGRRRSEQADAAGREAALRRTYEHELEREVAARREYELELENELRRETEGTLRAELDALREELSGVTELRREVARVAELREDVAGLSALRDEVARVAALRDDVLSLTALRAELGQIGDLRADLGRLRAEIVEQLSSEMLVERIVMRTQAGRLPSAEHGRIDAGPAWRDEPPRELTGGWPAVRLDEHAGTQQYERVRVERPAPPRPWEPAGGPATAPSSASVVPPEPERPLSSPPPQPPPTAAWSLPPVPAEPSAPVRPAQPEPSSWPAVAPVTEAYGMSLPPRRSRHSTEGEGAADPYAAPADPPPSPLEWLSSRSLLDAPAGSDVPPTAERPRPAPRRRRDDGDLVPPPADDVLTTERPAAGRPSGAGHPFGPPSPLPGDGPAGHTRLEEILAESGVQPASGSRRRRRYRDEDGSDDDVLSRVLRGG